MRHYARNRVRLLSACHSILFIAFWILIFFPVLSSAQQAASPIPATHFIYPVDRDDVDGDKSWVFRERGQSQGSLANDIYNMPPKPHFGEDWNWGLGDDEKITGKQAFAIANGVVVAIWNRYSEVPDEWGKSILIRHDAPDSSLFVAGNGQWSYKAYSFYAHLHRIFETVEIGEPISIAQPIGIVGNGNGFYKGAAHLHFEIRVPPAGGEADKSLGPGYGWDLMDRVPPSEFIENNLVVNGRQFSVWVHPYERLEPDEEASLKLEPADHWDIAGGGVFIPELGHGGFIWERSASKAGRATWTPEVPLSGYYRIAQFIPGGYGSIDLEYTISHHQPDNDVTVESMSTINTSGYSDQWGWLVDRDSSLEGLFYFKKNDLLNGLSPAQVVLNTNPELGLKIPVDTMRFTYMGPGPAEFIDVQSDHWAHSYVEKLFEIGVIGSTEDLRYRPDDLVSRAAFLKIVIEASLGVMQLSTDIPERPLPDVPIESWYAPHVLRALEMGLDVQCSVGFCPKEPVTRTWAASLLKDAFPIVLFARDRVGLGFPRSGEPYDSIDACRLVGAMEGVNTEDFYWTGSSYSLDPGYMLRRSDAAKAVAVAKFGKRSFE